MKALLLVTAIMLSGCSLSWESELTTNPSVDLYGQACLLGNHCVSVGADGNTGE